MVSTKLALRTLPRLWQEGSMFFHLILGFLRDGEPRHGYELVTQYRTRSGRHTSPGGFYRELSRLTTVGLVTATANRPGADARRIPYRITGSGRREFDRWLLAPPADDLAGWLLFLDRVPPDAIKQVLDRREEELWLRSRVLRRAREDAIREHEETGPTAPYDPLPVVILRQMKRIEAELEFFGELRRQVGAGADRPPSLTPLPLASPGLH